MSKKLKTYVMAKVTIDGKEYDSDDLSEEVKNIIASLNFLKNETIRLNGQLAAYKTAEATYLKALKDKME